MEKAWNQHFFRLPLIGIFIWLVSPCINKLVSWLFYPRIVEVYSYLLDVCGVGSVLYPVKYLEDRFDIISFWAGGLTENDFILASKINKLDVHQLLSRKVSLSSQHDC